MIRKLTSINDSEIQEHLDHPASKKPTSPLFAGFIGLDHSIPERGSAQKVQLVLREYWGMLLHHGILLVLHFRLAESEGESQEQ